MARGRALWESLVGFAILVVMCFKPYDPDKLFVNRVAAANAPKEKEEQSPRCLSPLQGNLFSLHCLDFQAEDRLTPRWHVGQLCGKASWESLEGKPQIP